MPPRLQHKVKIQWSPDFAYAIGLIASDGYLSKNGKTIALKAADLELVENFRQALAVKNKISTVPVPARSTVHYSLQVGDKAFYRFLNGIGITNAKSKTIKSVAVPDDYFQDFLRGLFDGDGTFYTFWDKRWPKAFGYRIALASASHTFIIWLKDELWSRWGLNGVLHKGKGVYMLEYVKGDTRGLFEIMYYHPGLLSLKRKYDKMVAAFEKDRLLHAGVAQR